MHRKALAHLRTSDPVIKSVIERVGPCRLRPATTGTNFDFVARSIIYQQLSTRAASTIYARVRDLCGGSHLTAGSLRDLPDTDLRSAGLSRQKMGYLRDLATRTATGVLNAEVLGGLPDEEVTRQLVQVKGIGIWTAQMVLMFRLGRPDILPATDLGIRKGVRQAYHLRKLPDPSRVERIGAAWAPYRTVASWYLWRLLETEAAGA
jgi:3-methyladenine DNA glycosylase/8-oxoguanine DNA glycosylase